MQRRNRPNLAIGDLVYARVTVASRDMEPELACTDASGKVAADILQICTVDMHLGHEIMMRIKTSVKSMRMCKLSQPHWKFALDVNIFLRSKGYSMQVAHSQTQNRTGVQYL